MASESGTVNGILEAYTNDALKEKLNRLDILLKAVDAQSKQPILTSFSSRAVLNSKHFCLDCGRRLKTHGAKRCVSCNMKMVGKNHVETRKKKGGV